ncbi:energy transducer TonB [Erythrobacter sp. HA6-11]
MIERHYAAVVSSRGRPSLILYGVEPFADPARDQLDPFDQESMREVLTNRVTPAERSERLQAIRSLTLGGSVRQPVTLELEGFAEAYASLSACSSVLSNRFGVHSNEPDYAGTGPKPRFQERWARRVRQSYPLHMYEKGLGGRVAIELAVDTQGRATNCTVTGYVGPASFNEIVCLILIQHAMFDPATDAEGSPVPAYYYTQVTFSP